MRTDRPKTNLTTRQKVVAIVFVLVVIMIIYQLINLFRGPRVAITAKPQTANVRTLPVQQLQPRPLPLPKLEPAQMTATDMQLLQLQQQTEAKYIAALNELQMLKVDLEIAQTTQAIAAAKLQTVTAQKNTINTISPPPPPPTPAPVVVQQPINLTRPVAATPPPAATTRVTTTTKSSETETPYVVVSVSQLHSRWRAVINYEGNLYQVFVGDILPPDGSKVISINNFGVVLRKHGVTRRVSLVPII